MDARLKKLWELESDLGKILELIRLPQEYVDNLIAELMQSLVKEIGELHGDVKMEWLHRLEIVKKRYAERQENGIDLPDTTALEKELIGLQFRTQSLMGDINPPIEEINAAIGKFMETIGHIPSPCEELKSKWNHLADILMSDYTRLASKKQALDITPKLHRSDSLKMMHAMLASEPTTEPAKDFDVKSSAAPVPFVQQQQPFSNNSYTSSAIPSNVQESDDWGAAPNMSVPAPVPPVKKQSSFSVAVDPVASYNWGSSSGGQAVDIRPNQMNTNNFNCGADANLKDFDVKSSAAPVPFVQQQQQSFSNFNSNVGSAIPSNNAQESFDDWGAAPETSAPAPVPTPVSAPVSSIKETFSNVSANPMPSNDWGQVAENQPKPLNTNNFNSGSDANPPMANDAWGSAPNANDHGNYQSGNQPNQSNDWGSADNGSKQQNQFNDWGSSNYGAAVNQGGDYYGQEANAQQKQPVRSVRPPIDEDPHLAAIRKEINKYIEIGYGRMRPLQDGTDIRSLRILLQKTTRAKRLIEVFKGNRSQMFSDAFELAVSKLSEDLKSQVDIESKNFNSLLQLLSQTLKDLSEAESRKPAKDELSELFNCTFCKVAGHHNGSCPVIHSLLCNTCVRYGHTSKRCPNETLEPEMIGII